MRSLNASCLIIFLNTFSLILFLDFYINLFNFYIAF